MTFLFVFLSALTSIYMLVILFRVILSWFPGTGQDGIVYFIRKITDPYLNWFRRFGFRIGHIDLSPILAIGVLSMLNRVFAAMSARGFISLGLILALLLQAVWSFISLLIIIMIIILVLRLIAHYMKIGGGGFFWRMIDNVSHQVIYRINRFILRDRIINFGISVIVSLVIMLLSYFILRFTVTFLSILLVNMPV